jgi:ParB/RepB/Spo0J family partition protein
MVTKHKSSDLPVFAELPIADIDIGERYRKDPDKDLDTLADSIDTLGLLQPIVVTPKPHKLIAGERRVLAYRKLGFEVIEAHIVHDLDDANLLLAEHDENICRVQMTTGEARQLFAA